MNGINFLNLEIMPLQNHNGRDDIDRIYTDGEIKAVTNALQEIALQYKGTGARVELALYKTTKHRTPNGKEKKRGVIMATLSGHFLQRIYFHFNPKTGKITGKTYGESKLYDGATPGKFLKPATPADQDDGIEWQDPTEAWKQYQAETARREWQEKNEGATE